MPTEFTSVNDTDRNDADSIQPYGNENASPVVLRRPPENLRARTEVLRAEANRARFVSRVARTMQIHHDGEAAARWYGSWDGTGSPTTEGTLVLVSGGIVFAPIIGAGEDRDPTDALKYSTTGDPHADLLAYYDLRIGADPEYVRIVADGKEESGTAFLTLTITRSSADLPGGVPIVRVLGTTPATDLVGFSRGQVDIEVEISNGVATTTTYQKLVDALNDPASPTYGLVTAYVMVGASTVCPTLPRARFTAGLNAVRMTLTAGQLAAFFTASTANRLREGDTLAVSLDRWQTLLAKTPDNATQAILAGDLCNLTREPGKAATCVPICRVLDSNLHFSNGVVLARFSAVYPPDVEPRLYAHSTNLITPVLSYGDTELNTETVAGQLSEIAEILDQLTVDGTTSSDARLGTAFMFGPVYFSGGAVTAGVGGSVNVSAVTYRSQYGPKRTTTSFTNVPLNAADALNYVTLNPTTGSIQVFEYSDYPDAEGNIVLALVAWDQVSVVQAVSNQARALQNSQNTLPVVLGSIGGTDNIHNQQIGLYAAVHRLTRSGSLFGEIVLRGQNTYAALAATLPGLTIQSGNTITIRGDNSGTEEAALSLSSHSSAGIFTIEAGGTLIIEDLYLTTSSSSGSASIFKMSGGRLVLKNVRMNMDAVASGSSLLPEALIECTSWDVKVEILDGCELNAAKRILYMNLAASAYAEHDIVIRDSRLRLQESYGSQEYLLEFPAEDTLLCPNASIEITRSVLADSAPLKGVRLWAGKIKMTDVVSMTTVALYSGASAIGVSGIDTVDKGTVRIDGYTYEPTNSIWFPLGAPAAIKPLYIRRGFGHSLRNLVFNDSEDEALLALSDTFRNAYLVLSDCTNVTIDGVSVHTRSTCAAIAFRASNSARNRCHIRSVHVQFVDVLSTPREGVFFNGSGTISGVISENCEDEKTVVLDAGSQRTIVSSMSVNQPTATGDGTTDSGTSNVIDTATISVY